MLNTIFATTIMYTLSFTTGVPGSCVIFLLFLGAERKGGPKKRLRKFLLKAT